MRLTLDALAVLDAIDRCGSFAAAAEQLYRVPSAITYTIQKLEQDLGIEVYDRSGHRARLTPAGTVLLNEGRHLLRRALELEATAKRVATGWEIELPIALVDLLPLDWMNPILSAFYREQPITRIRLTHEVLGGCRDALLSGRSDLAIGAIGEGLSHPGFASRVIGTVPFIFVMPPDHPLIDEPEPLSSQIILRHRAVAVADSSRTLPPMTAALFEGQDVLTVPTMEAKLDAHRQGLGVGYVPAYMARHDLASGRLVTRTVMDNPPSPQLYLAWRTEPLGKALQWFLDYLQQPGLFDGLVSNPPVSKKLNS